MKRISILVFAAALLLALPACSILKQAVKIPLAIANFLGAVDDQVTRLCEDGYLPPVACDEWAELKSRAAEKWDATKEAVLKFVSDLLGGSVSPPAAEGPRIARAEADEILAAARKLFDEGYITGEELAFLEAAAK